jgi:hypothetical protein
MGAIAIVVVLVVTAVSGMKVHRSWPSNYSALGALQVSRDGRLSPDFGQVAFRRTLHSFQT